MKTNKPICKTRGKLKKICETINIIKPKGTFAKAKPIKNFHNILNKFDIIFCASIDQQKN